MRSLLTARISTLRLNKHGEVHVCNKSRNLGTKRNSNSSGALKEGECLQKTCAVSSLWRDAHICDGIAVRLNFVVKLALLFANNFTLLLGLPFHEHLIVVVIVISSFVLLPRRHSCVYNVVRF